MTPQVTVKQWVGSLCKGLFWRHVVNLTLLVDALLRSRKVGVAALGRELRVDTIPKYAIKRVDRFLGNARLDTHTVMRGLLAYLTRGRPRVVLAVDWTKVRHWSVLVASVVYKGRALPVAWAVTHPAALHKSQNGFEHAFFALLSTLRRPGQELVVLLDRGFRRVDLLPQLRRYNLRYVIRSGGNAHAVHPRYRGPLQGVITARGQRCDLRDVALRQWRPVCTRIVGLWEFRQKEAWILATDLDLPAYQIARLYGRRFEIEESFRDQKSHRFGLSLGLLKLRHGERLERLLLVVALALLLAMLVGQWAAERGRDRQYRANTERRKRTHSYFQLGLYYALRERWNPRALRHTLQRTIAEIYWG